jgi:hypothetical protein
VGGGGDDVDDADMMMRWLETVTPWCGVVCTVRP